MATGPKIGEDEGGVQVAVYTGAGLTSLTKVAYAYSDDSGRPIASIAATPGTTYYIGLDSRWRGIASHTRHKVFTLLWRSYAIAANDDFSDAIILASDTGQTTTTNSFATKESGEPSHANNSGGRSLWWTWTPTQNTPVVIDTHGSDFDTLLAVYTGPSVDNLTPVASNDDDGAANGASGVAFPAQAGTQYHIAVDGRSNAGGMAYLNRRTATEATNNDFINATEISAATGSQTTSNEVAWKETGEPNHAGNSGGNSVWWKWTPTQTRFYHVHTHGSAIDTLLGVYGGASVDALEHVSSNRNDGSANNNSGLIFLGRAGVTYYIAVDGYNNSTGNLILTWGPARRVFVNGDAVTSGDGTSWAQAMRSIGEGMTTATFGSAIWVAEDTYPETITIKSGVALLGGFAGDETQLTARDIAAHPTIIDSSNVGESQAADHVLVMDNLNGGARADGFTLTGGNANGSWPHYYGGGILSRSSDASTVIANNTIVNNRADSAAAGIFCEQSSPLITHNTIIGNSAPNSSGGGIYATGGAPIIRGGVIAGNYAYYGGAVLLSSINTNITSVTIAGNWANHSGG